MREDVFVAYEPAAASRFIPSTDLQRQSGNGQTHLLTRYCIANVRKVFSKAEVVKPAFELPIGKSHRLGYVNIDIPLARRRRVDVIRDLQNLTWPLLHHGLDQGVYSSRSIPLKLTVFAL